MQEQIIPYYQVREVIITKIIYICKDSQFGFNGKDCPEVLNQRINWNLRDDDMDGPFLTLVTSN